MSSQGQGAILFVEEGTFRVLPGDPNISVGIPERSQSTRIVEVEMRIVWAGEMDERSIGKQEIDEEREGRDLGYGRWSSCRRCRN